VRHSWIGALVGVLLVATHGGSPKAWAADPPECRTVRLADIGWVDVAATTALTAHILTDLGYTPVIVPLSVPATYEALKAKSLDVFLGNWMPGMAAARKPYDDDKSIDVIGPNLQGAKYTLAVPHYLWARGLHDFQDVAKFGRQLGFKIYGLEAGNEGNQHLRQLIGDKRFGFDAFTLVEESEPHLLAHLRHAYHARRPILFLGWEPHPMNRYYRLDYLTGGDDLFGPNFGAASVFTNVRAGYAAACPNVAKLLANETFSLAQEDAIMALILGRKMPPAKAAAAWLRTNKGAPRAWLDGVTTFDGKPVPQVLVDLSFQTWR
jgi:glycine betaine/proline transport system substrate-binding protein